MDFSHFLYSSDNIPEGFGFSHFSPLHFFWLFLGVAIAALSCLLYRRLQRKGRRRMLWIMTALLVGDEIWKLAWLLSLGLFTHSYLPFHLCSINIFLILFFTVKPNQIVGNFLYAICIPTTTAALLFPTWTKLPFWNFMNLHFLGTYPFARNPSDAYRRRRYSAPSAQAPGFPSAAFGTCSVCQGFQSPLRHEFHVS